MKMFSTYGAVIVAAMISTITPSIANAASCEGDWSISLDRTVRGGRSEPYVGKLTVSGNSYTLRAMADIYVMVSEGPIADCKLTGAKLSFTNRSSSYAMDLTLNGNAGSGRWYDTTFTKDVIAKR